jgi:hypothetical protein
MRSPQAEENEEMHSPWVRTLTGAALGLALYALPAGAFADRGHSRREIGLRIDFSSGHGSRYCRDRRDVFFRDRHDRFFRDRVDRYGCDSYPDLVVRRAYARYDWDDHRHAYRRVIRILIENRGYADACSSVTSIRFFPEHGRRCEDLRIATPCLRRGEAVWISDADRCWFVDGRERGRFTVETDGRHDVREDDEGNNRFGPVDYRYDVE